MPPFGTNGPDIFTGTPGNDTLYGYGDADFFYHSAGNDHFDGGSGAGTADGTDYDTLSYVLSDKAVIVDARLAVGNTTFAGSTERDTFTAMEKIVGSTHNDVMYAGNTTDLDGFAGDDWIFSGAGANELAGGSGIDTLSYGLSIGGVTVDLSGQLLGDDVPHAEGGWAQGDVISGFENVVGSAYDDVIVGDQQNNMLAGGNGIDGLFGWIGNDTLYGGNGNDILDGGAGNDLLAGDAGRDLLYGGTGNDRLTGGAGSDILYGDLGADRFIYTQTSDSVAGSGIDTIRDFSRAQGDKIDLSAIDANQHLAGNQSFSFNLLEVDGAAGWSSQFTAGTIAVRHFNGDTYLAINTNDFQTANGYDAPEMEIRLEGIHDLVWSDFIL